MAKVARISYIRPQHEAGDVLIHAFCPHCWDTATKRAWLRRAFCGSQGRESGIKVVWFGRSVCMVCMDMLACPCRTCGAIVELADDRY